MNALDDYIILDQKKHSGASMEQMIFMKFTMNCSEAELIENIRQQSNTASREISVHSDENR